MTTFNQNYIMGYFCCVLRNYRSTCDDLCGNLLTLSVADTLLLLEISLTTFAILTVRISRQCKPVQRTLECWIVQLEQRLHSLASKEIRSH